MSRMNIVFFRVAITSACALLLAPPVISLSYMEPHHYGFVSTQSDRAAGKYGYTPFPNFPHIEVVKEKDGIPNLDLTRLIPDADLKREVEGGEYDSLQVRNFTPQFAEATRDGDKLIIPFGLSLKYKANLISQGTLNLAGTLTVQTNGGEPVANITDYFDSTFVEQFERMYLLNTYANIRFARAIAESQLTHWVQEDPTRLQRLINDARPADGIARP